MSEIRICVAEGNNSSWIDSLYQSAFPEEDLRSLVHELIGDSSLLLSLHALRADVVVGHIAFTQCEIKGCSEILGLLGPLAVSPANQKQGVGSSLINKSLELLSEKGVARILVLGDPNYYSRFGFESESDIQPPYSLPEAWDGAWRSRSLCEGDRTLNGVLQVPRPWQRTELWGP